MFYCEIFTEKSRLTGYSRDPPVFNVSKKLLEVRYNKMV